MIANVCRTAHFRVKNTNTAWTTNNNSDNDKRKKKKECGPTLSGGMNEKTDHGFIHIIERNIRPGE